MKELKIKQLFEKLKLVKNVEVIKLMSDLFEDNLSLSRLYKGNGNTTDSPENGDYRIVVNVDGDLVVQYRDNGAWDTDNETSLATPS